MSRAAIVINVAILNAFLSLFLIVTGTAAKAKESASAKMPAERFELPIHIYRGYLVVVEGSIGGLEHQNLIVDTGTDPSIVSAEIVQALRIPVRRATLTVADTTMDSDSAILPQLRVGPVHTQILPVMVQDFHSLERELGIPVGAIIGLDVLGQSNFSLDYSSRRIIFGPILAQGIALPLGAASPAFPTVDLLVGGQNAHLLVDTGAAGLVFFEGRVGNRLPLRNLSSFRQDASIAGSFETRMVSPGELLLGGHRFHLDKAFVAKGRGDVGKSFDGLLGVGAMGFKSISFDFISKRMYLQI